MMPGNHVSVFGRAGCGAVGACATLALVLAVVLTLVAMSEAAFNENPPEGGPAGKEGLAILNPISAFDSNTVGARVGYSLREKLRRSQRFAVPEELDIDEALAGGGARAEVDDVATARGFASRFNARFLVWGEVTEEEGYLVSLRALDITGDGSIMKFEKAAATQRDLALACRDLADEIAKAFTGEGYSETYPSMSAAGYSQVGPNLVKNGTFEKGANAPEGWERPDGLCSFWQKMSGLHGRVIRFDTNVYLSQWKEWRTRFDGGAPVADAPKKTPTTGDRYDTVAGTYGARLYSDMMSVKPGATYVISFDALGRTQGDLFFPKVFVKGYGDGATMEYYNMYKAVKPTTESWEHFVRIFHPTERAPQVKFMRVMLYAYWPPGEYYFDNVQVYEVKSEEQIKAEKEKAEEEAIRRKNFGALPPKPAGKTPQEREVPDEEK